MMVWLVLNMIGIVLGFIPVVGPLFSFLGAMNQTSKMREVNVYGVVVADELNQEIFCMRSLDDTSVDRFIQDVYEERRF